jgi:hypothetical protein
MSLPVERIETLLIEIEKADPYESAAIASKIRRLVDEAANGESDQDAHEPTPQGAAVK